MNYATAEGQAWLRYWVGIMPGSVLARYLDAPLTNGRLDEQRRRRIWPEPVQPRQPKLERAPAAARQTRPHHAPPMAQATGGGSRPATKVTKEERRIARDIARVTRLPVSDWAKAILGDERIKHLTLSDVLRSVEDYFSVFDQLKRTNRDAYAYFRRIGAPLMPSNGLIYTKHMTALTVARPDLLPSYFGVFLARSKDEYREDALEDKPSILDFHLFEKPKNHGTCAPLDSTVFTHNIYSLKRDVFTREELRTLPHAKQSWGFWWYLGVLADGSVRALPHHMRHAQRLPNGDHVYHSAFHVPPGLKSIAESMPAETGKTPHDAVRIWFNTAVAMTASACAGVTVTIRQGRRVCRVGVPVTNLKHFFADRERQGMRRKAILHLRLGHDRHMADGRIIPVGEHLSGTRFFTWRGYDIAVGVPGIHFPAPEAYTAPIFFDGDRDAPPHGIDPQEIAPVQHVAKTLSGLLHSRRAAPIRKGEPVHHYHEAHLPQPPSRSDERAAQ